jgi:MFS family permease
MPYSVAVYMVRALLAKEAGGAPDEAAVGTWTGVLAAAFSFSQFLTSMAWGRVSDSVGRKPIVAMSALSSGLSAIAFGLAPTFGGACAARLVGGAFNSTFGALKSIIAEASAAHGAGQTGPMSMLALAWGMGTIVGPALGALAAPCGGGGERGRGSSAIIPAGTSLLARAWPAGCAARTGLWVRHPFLPPCLVAAAFSVAALAVSVCVLEETLPLDRRRASSGALAARLSSSLARAARGRALGRLSTLSSPYVGPGAVERPGGGEGVELAHRGGGGGGGGGSGGEGAEEESLLSKAGPAAATARAPSPPAASPPAAPWFKSRPVLFALAGYGSTAALFNLIDELLPVFASAPTAAGGLGLSPSHLAAALGVGGAALIVAARWGYRAIHARIGTLACARAGLGGAAPLCLLLPLPSLLPGGPAATALRVAALSCLLAVRSLVANLAFTAAMLSINVSSPPGDVGLVNGAGQTIASAVRAAGPAAGGALWGASSLLRPGGQFLPFALVACAMAAAARLFHHVTPPPDEVELFHSGRRAGGRGSDEEAAGPGGGGGAAAAAPTPSPGRTIPAAWVEDAAPPLGLVVAVPAAEEEGGGGRRPSTA